jgi:hypothetical protein
MTDDFCLLLSSAALILAIIAFAISLWGYLRSAGPGPDR